MSVQVLVTGQTGRVTAGQAGRATARQVITGIPIGQITSGVRRVRVGRPVLISGGKLLNDQRLFASFNVTPSLENKPDIFMVRK